MRINHASFAPVYRDIRIFAGTFEKVERRKKKKKKKKESFFFPELARSCFSFQTLSYTLFVLIFDKGIRDDIVAVRLETLRRRKVLKENLISR